MNEETFIPIAECGPVTITPIPTRHEQAVAELVEALERIAVSADDLASEWANNALAKYRNQE